MLHDGFARASARQDLMQDALDLWKNGQVGYRRSAARAVLTAVLDFCGAKSYQSAQSVEWMQNGRRVACHEWTSWTTRGRRGGQCRDCAGDI